MSEPGIEAKPRDGADRDPEAAEDQKYFAYQGSRVPIYVAVLWAVFIVWSVVYIARWVPESWREWFAR